MTETTTPDFIPLAAELVMAYVGNNVVPTKELPGLLASVHAALVGLAAPAEDVPTGPEKASAAEIRKSITNDHLISFEDGKRYKTLRRHLTLRGLSPESYRAKWGLPADYPMTSASYSEQRAALAKAIGLGRPGGRAARQAAE